MKVEEIKEEIAHQHELIRGYRKRQRVLEQQAAVFGLHVPPHIQIEVDELGEKIQSCGKRILFRKISENPPDEKCFNSNSEMKPQKRSMSSYNPIISNIHIQ